MAISLDSIVTSERRHNRKVGIYSDPAVGKTTFFAGNKALGLIGAPNPIFIMTEDGMRDIDEGVSRFPGIIDTYKEFHECLDCLLNDSHSYETVVIDSLSGMQLLIGAKVAPMYTENSVRAVSGGCTSLDEIRYRNGYKIALKELNIVLAKLDRLFREKDMHIGLIGHKRTVTFEPPGGDLYKRYRISLDEYWDNVILEWLDELFYAKHKTTQKTEKKEFGREKHGEVMHNKRVMMTKWTTDYDAKQRLSLPDEILIDWNIYSSYFYDKELGGSVAGMKNAAIAARRTIINPLIESLGWKGDKKKVDEYFSGLGMKLEDMLTVTDEVFTNVIDQMKMILDDRKEEMAEFIQSDFNDHNGKEQ